MVWLQSYERYDTFGRFDPASSALKEYRRRLLGRRPPRMPHGFYSKLGDLFLAVYGLAGKLYLAFGTRVIEIGGDEKIEVSGPRSARLLRVHNRNEEPIVEFEYCLDGVPGPIPNDPTPFLAAEDFDIGLLASTISKSAERRAVFTDKPEKVSGRII